MCLVTQMWFRNGIRHALVDLVLSIITKLRKVNFATKMHIRNTMGLIMCLNLIGSKKY